MKWEPDKMLAEMPALIRFCFERSGVFLKVSQNFTEGKIFAPLVRFTGPLLLALLLQTMYSAVDMMVVGQFASAADVSAVSTGSWVIGIITSFVVGISMGTTILLGRRIGEGRPEDGGKIIGASIVLFVILSVVLTVVAEVLAVPLAKLLQTPEEAFDATLQYMRICAAGTVFIAAYNVLGSIFRGIGNSTVPLLTVAIACVINIIGDLVFCGVFHMAAAGAALATVLAQAVSVVLSLLLLRGRKFDFTFRPKQDIRWNTEIVGQVFKLGLPIAFQEILVSASFMVITAIVNSLGVIASAGVGVAGKLCNFIMMVPSAFSQAMSAFVAQNMGAGKPKRARRALLCGISTSFAVGVVMFVLAFFFGDVMSMIFTQDAEVIAASADYLKSYAIDCLLVAFMFCLTGYFSGCGHTTFVMAQGIIGAFGVRIPVSFLMSRIQPVSLFLVGLATPCSTLVQIIFCVVYFVLLLRKEKQEGTPLRV